MFNVKLARYEEEGNHCKDYKELAQAEMDHIDEDNSKKVEKIE